MKKRNKVIATLLGIYCTTYDDILSFVPALHHLFLSFDDLYLEDTMAIIL